MRYPKSWEKQRGPGVKRPYPFHRLNTITKTTGTNSLGCDIAPLQRQDTDEDQVAANARATTMAHTHYKAKTI